MIKPQLPGRASLAGQWCADVRWEFYLSNQLPEALPCTAVFCLALTSDEPLRVVLTRNHRGWELLGGHLEPGESLEQALHREALEEGGFCVSSAQLFGYRAVTNLRPVANDHHGGSYPPLACIPYFVATTDQPLVPPSGEEIFEAATFDLTSLPPMDASALSIIKAGLDSFSTTRLPHYGIVDAQDYSQLK